MTTEFGAGCARVGFGQLGHKSDWPKPNAAPQCLKQMIPNLQNLQVGSDTGVVRVESENRVGKWLWGDGWFNMEGEDLKKKRMDYLKSFEASKRRLSTRLLWKEVVQTRGLHRETLTPSSQERVRRYVKHQSMTHDAASSKQTSHLSTCEFD